jgi:hypothetical protein
MVEARAQKIASGASFITKPVTFSMTWAPCSASSRICGALLSSEATAVPTNRLNTTICRISFLAMASKIEVGTRWVRKPCRVKVSVEAAGALAATLVASFSTRPAPGCSRWTISRPSSSETAEALMNQPMVLAPIRPTAAASSMWAMPATRVVNTSGAMIILISRRNRSVPILNHLTASAVWAGSRYWLQAQPTRTPRTMAAMIR